MRLALTYLMTLLVVSVVHAEDRSLAEREYQELLEEFETRMREDREAYMKEPDSVFAHIRSIQAFRYAEDYDKALEVIHSFERQDPESRRAAMYRKQMNELKQLGGAEVPEAMIQRHKKESEQAFEEDAKRGGSAARKREKSDYLKESGNRQIARMKKRFPNLCGAKGVSKNLVDSEARFEIQSRVVKIEMEFGNQGLRAAYPKLIEEHPESKFLKIEYAQFLLHEKEYAEARALVQRAMQQFPDEPELILMQEKLENFESITLVEERAFHFQELRSDLWTLTQAKSDCSLLPAAPSVHAEVHNLAEVEQESQQLLEEVDARLRENRDAYLKEPDSEVAHFNSIVAFMTAEQYDKALEVINRLERLIPESRAAIVYRGQIEELRQLGSAEVPLAMRQRHMAEALQAVKDDAVRGVDSKTLELLSVGRGKDRSEYLKKAEEMTDRRIAEMKGRFPDLCRANGFNKNRGNSDALSEIERRIWKVRSEFGNQGLRAAYPELIEEHPDVKFLKVEYAKFLLHEGKYNEARGLVQRAIKQFPDEPALIVMQEELGKLESIISVEQKAVHVQQLLNDLTTLIHARANCSL